MDLSFSVSDSILFFDHFESLWGLLLLSGVVISIAQIRPFMAIALICFYPNILWAASWKPFVTLYPFYFLVLFLCLKHSKNIFIAFLNFRYRYSVVLSIIIITWSFLSPWIYPPSGEEAFSFASNPNYKRWFEILIPLILLPATIKNLKDIQQFLLSTLMVTIVIHMVAIIISIMFLMFGHAFHELHRIVSLNMRPIYWESGLLLIFIAYAFILNKYPAFILIVLAIVGCAGLLLGNSRTRFLCTILCYIYFIYPYISKRLFVWGISFLFMFSIVVAGTSLFSGKVNMYFSGLVDQRIEQSLSKNANERTSGRATTYKYALERLKVDTLFGVGSCYIYPTTKFGNKSTSIGRIHNYFLEVLAGQGIAGFTLLLAVIGISILSVFKVFRLPAREAIVGRMIVGLYFWGIINWMFKESWGITYTAICLLSVYTLINDRYACSLVKVDNSLRVKKKCC